MARGAAQARRKTAKSQPRRQSAARRPPSIEQTMFFPRLRRQAKWVFVFLAFVFAAGFVFFGVGSGSTGIGDLLRGNFNIFGGGGGSKVSSGVKSALKETQQHPNDPTAWNDLATAYQSDGKLTQANQALEHYLRLRPNDVDALQRAAGYYENRATQKDNAARTLAAQAPIGYAAAVGVSPTSQLGQMLGQDQIAQQLSQKANTAFTDSRTALQHDEQLYKRIAKVQASDPNTQYHLAQIADFLGDSKVALAAYRKVVRLAPTDPTAATARQRIRQLSSGTGASAPR